jgi:NDP-sugar pyrophosphorylase family protein
MGELRAGVLREGKRKGYRLITYVSSRAMTWPGFVAGENCMVYDGVIVEPFARIGENCIIRAGATLSHDVELGDHCFVAPRASIGGRVEIGANCVIGANSTISRHPAGGHLPRQPRPPVPGFRRQVRQARQVTHQRPSLVIVTGKQ